MSNLLLEGPYTTFRLSKWDTLLASVLGLIFVLMRSSNRFFFRLVAGIESIERDQREASSALGLLHRQQMIYIILPQAGRRVLPPLANEFINTVKYSFLVSIISIQELTFQGMQIMAAIPATIEIWLTITLFYLFICLLLSLAVRFLESKLTYAEQ